jgi:hypothetical protein
VGWITNEAPQKTTEQANSLKAIPEGVSMFSTKIARMLLVPAAVMIPVSVTTVALTTGVASATTVADSAKCAALTGTVNIGTESATGTLTKCTDPANTDKGGKFTGSDETSTASVTWNGGYGVTSASFDFTIGGSACGVGYEEIVVTGTVTKSTKKSVSIKKGQPISATVCWNQTNNKISLLKGTDFDL